jgi:hypothetical protein
VARDSELQNVGWIAILMMTNFSLVAFEILPGSHEFYMFVCFPDPLVQWVTILVQAENGSISLLFCQTPRSVNTGHMRLLDQLRTFMCKTFSVSDKMVSRKSSGRSDFVGREKLLA